MRFDGLRLRRRGVVLALTSGLVLGMAIGTLAAEPSWDSRVIKRGADRDRINSMPIEDRPNRPLHFYGNTVRRIHHRGSAMPLPRDVSKGVRALVVRQ